MSTTGTIRLQYMAGEIIEPLRHQFKDDDGVIIDLTGYQGVVTWGRDVDGATGEVTATISGATGEVTVTMPAASTAVPGVVDVVFWAGNGSHRPASVRWRLLLADPPGTAPSI